MKIEEIRELDIAGIEERAGQIEAEMTAEDADLDALQAEAGALAERKAELAKQAEQRKAEEAAALAVKNVERSFNEKKEKKMFEVNSIEYRDAWVKSLIGRDMSTEERDALTSAAAVIPTMTVNAIWDKLVKPAELLGRVDVSQFPTYVRFPKATTVSTASGQAIGTTISESSDIIGYVDLVPNEYVKLLTVGADIDHMAISAVHDWIVENLTSTIRYAINKDIVIGSGTNSLKGLTASISSANATPIPATVTKASLLKIMGTLGAAYQNGAVWIMTPEMFYENVMTITQLNDYIINDGFSFRLFGHDVILMSECLISSKETIFYGDPKAYKVNFFKPLEVKSFETATTTNLQFRGATLVDGELLDTSAFVRFAQS